MAQSNAGFPVKVQDSIDAPAKFYSGVLWGKFLMLVLSSYVSSKFQSGPEFEDHGFIRQNITYR